jgi:hypothetical protein
MRQRARGWGLGCLVSISLLGACGDHGEAETPDPSAIGGEGGGGPEGDDLVAPGSGTSGTGGSSSPLRNGCECNGDGFGARVRFGGDEELLELNRSEEARCAPGAPAHVNISGTCVGDLLSFWLGQDPHGAPPHLTVLGGALTYVDRTGVVWTAQLDPYPETELDAASVLVGELDVTVANEAGETRALHVSYKLCAAYLPRALIVC